MENEGNGGGTETKEELNVPLNASLADNSNSNKVCGQTVFEEGQLDETEFGKSALIFRWRQRAFSKSISSCVVSEPFQMFVTSKTLKETEASKGGSDGHNEQQEETHRFQGCKVSTTMLVDDRDAERRLDVRHSKPEGTREEERWRQTDMVKEDGVFSSYLDVLRRGLQEQLKIRREQWNSFVSGRVSSAIYRTRYTVSEMYIQALTWWCFRHWRVRVLADALTAMRRPVDLHIVSCPPDVHHRAGYSPSRHAVWFCGAAAPPLPQVPISEGETAAVKKIQGRRGGGWPVERHDSAQSQQKRRSAEWWWWPWEFRRCLVHEMIHAFDFARAEMNICDCRHIACTELRAYHLSEQCGFWNTFHREYRPFRERGRGGGGTEAGKEVGKGKEGAGGGRNGGVEEKTKVGDSGAEELKGETSSFSSPPPSSFPSPPSTYPSSSSPSRSSPPSGLPSSSIGSSLAPSATASSKTREQLLSTTRTLINNSAQNRCLAHNAIASLLDYQVLWSTTKSAGKPAGQQAAAIAVAATKGNLRDDGRSALNAHRGRAETTTIMQPPWRKQTWDKGGGGETVTAKQAFDKHVKEAEDCVLEVFERCVRDTWPFVGPPERDSKWRPSRLYSK